MDGDDAHALASDVVGYARALLAIPSVSGEERAIADYVQACLVAKDGWTVERIGETVIASCPGTQSGQGRRVLLAGHLDTVPGADGYQEDDEWLFGLGACDMKGGLAVMLALADEELVNPTTLVFYPCEEVAFDRNGLHQLGPREAFLATHEQAVLLEPTDGVVELGCQGTLRLKLELHGRRAHTSRPWMGQNAIDRLGAVLTRLGDFDRRSPTLGGVEFRESLSPVRVEGFVANNVVPDRAVLWINYRFAPDLGIAEAQDRIIEWIGPLLTGEDVITLEDGAQGAAPTQVGFESLIGQAGQVRAKLGWTDVSFLSALGVPSVNYGPGDPLLAHGGHERLSKAALSSTLETLLTWINDAGIGAKRG